MEWSTFDDIEPGFQTVVIFDDDATGRILDESLEPGLPPAFVEAIEALDF